MSISKGAQVFIREQLEKAIRSTQPSVVCINESKSKIGTYIPYTKTLDDNLVLSMNQSGISSNYTPKAKNEMRAITSSSALTYNTFCEVNKTRGFTFDGTGYFKFIPESKRHPLNFDKNKQRGKANIDAELIGKNKVLMIEMKMFEPYYYSSLSTLRNIEKYKDEKYYNKKIFNDFQISSWINIFIYYENQIRLKQITQFDVIQFLKHLLSILNNKSSFCDNCEVELWAVTWHASMSSLELGEFRKAIMFYDNATIGQTIKTINNINDFIREQGYQNIHVFSEDYSNFVLRTNIDEYHEISNYLKRYI